MTQGEKRKRKLIEPRIQWRFALIFLTTSALAVLVQTMVLCYLMLGIADRLTNDGVELKSQLPDVLAASLFCTSVLLVPLTLAVGIKATHKVVGPLYRFRVYLGELAAGVKPQPCRIRKDDELQDFCELLNRVTEPLRRAEPAAAQPAPLKEEAA